MVTVSANLDLEFYNQMLPLILKVLGVFASMQLLDNFVLQPFISVLNNMDCFVTKWETFNHGGPM